MNDEQTTEAYPLCWPAGWPRTAAGSRKNAKFNRVEYKASSTPGMIGYTVKKGLSVYDATQRVREEMDKLDARGTVVSSNIPLRRDGLPYSGQKEPPDSGVAVYWTTRKGDRRCIATDRYTKVADNIAALAATLEAFRAVERHGGAQVIDRAFTGFKAIPNLEASRPWRVVLDVERYEKEGETIDDEWVRMQYLKLAHIHHPDKGGTDCAMAELNRARDEAIDDLSKDMPKTKK